MPFHTGDFLAGIAGDESTAAVEYASLIESNGVTGEKQKLVQVIVDRAFSCEQGGESVVRAVVAANILNVGQQGSLGNTHTPSVKKIAVA